MKKSLHNSKYLLQKLTYLCGGILYYMTYNWYYKHIDAIGRKYTYEMYNNILYKFSYIGLMLYAISTNALIVQLLIMHINNISLWTPYASVLVW